MSMKKAVLDWIKSIAISFAIFLVLRTFVVQTFVITSGSMERTLLVGDMLFVNKLYGAPRHRDVIVFRSPADTLDLVKRLIGLPGDTLAMKNGILYINRRAQNEPYAQHADPMPPEINNWGPIVVPKDSLFVMGDNRDNSYDSRFWGFLDQKRIKGKAEMIYYSYERDSEKPFPWFRARLNRVGHRIR